MSDCSISLTLKEFLTVKECPVEWQSYDIYRFRHAQPQGLEIVFYIGQSDCAFRRVWRHVEDGFKGRSLVGKFLRVNWPQSMNFTVDLLDSGYRESVDPASHRNAVERQLIGRHRPCFNDTWNEKPTPLPLTYKPPTSSVRFPRHLGRMMREARVAVERGCSDPERDTEW